MNRKQIIAVLAVTMLAVPVAFVGCGGNGDVTQEVTPSVNEAVVESTETPSNNEVSENIVIEETDDLDEDGMYVGERYCTGETNLYAEPSETAEVIMVLEEGTAVQAMGIHHVSQFYKVTLDDSTIGYIRTVDLTEFGEYDELTNDALLESEGADEETSDVGTGDSTSSSSGSDSGSVPTTGIVNNVDMGSMIDQGWVPTTDTGMDEEFTFGQGDYSELPPHTIQ